MVMWRGVTVANFGAAEKQQLMKQKCMVWKMLAILRIELVSSWLISMPDVDFEPARIH